MIRIILIIPLILLLFIFYKEDGKMVHSGKMGDLSFRMMAAIHDNRLRRVLDNPKRSLKSAGIQPDQHVLEVGCGPGFFTTAAAKLVGDEGRVYAIDLQPLAIETTKKKLHEAGVKNVELRIADAAQTGLPSESIDLVFLFGVVHALPLDTVLPELYRILKAGGSIAVRGFHGWAEKLARGGFFTSEGKNGGVNNFRKVVAM